MPKGDTVIVLLRPTGSTMGVYAAGTGRQATGRVRNRAARMVRELLPQLFAGRRSRRTSRAPSKSAERVKRTSRAARSKRRGR